MFLNLNWCEYDEYICVKRKWRFQSCWVDMFCKEMFLLKIFAFEMRCVTKRFALSGFVELCQRWFFLLTCIIFGIMEQWAMFILLLKMIFEPSALLIGFNPPLFWFLTKRERNWSKCTMKIVKIKIVDWFIILMEIQFIIRT